MISCDVNVLVHATNEDAPRHAEYRDWLESSVNAVEPFGLASIVASGFLRVATHPRILTRPIDTGTALDLLDGLRGAPAVVPLEPGREHWPIFDQLCRAVTARGNTVPDAYLAAMAIEQGCDWYSADRGFARFPGLRARHPLDR